MVNRLFMNIRFHDIFDSDGNIKPLIPLWLEFGINWIMPCEVAAGVDVVKLGERYSKLIMSGGIDKRELAKDEKS